MKSITHHVITLLTNCVFTLLTTSAVMLAVPSGLGSTADSLFRSGQDAYRVGDYNDAASLFRETAIRRPGAGTLRNLGLAEWQRANTGPAILAWEQALWVSPFESPSRENLRFARKISQLEAPELAWYEVVSTWLPANWWAWLSGLSFWTAISASLLPGILRFRKTVWQQALAAAGLAIFLLSVPAQLGVDRRARIGFVLQKDVPLRLTPTDHAQFITRLPAGEPARLQRYHANFLLIRTTHGEGWVERDKFGLICSSK